MIILKIFVYLLSLFLPGFFIVSLFGINSISLKSLSLYFGTGAYFVAMQIFIWMFLFQAPFNFVYFYILWFVEIAALSIIYFFFSKKKLVSETNTNTNEKLTPEKKSFWQSNRLSLILIILIFLQIFILATLAANRPNVSFDNLTMWLYEGKSMYFENSINFNPNEANYLGALSHPNYPRLLPILTFWFSKNIGYYSDNLINLVFFFFFLSLVGVVYSFGKEKIGKTKSLWIILFMVNFPLLSYHAYNGYADLTLSVYVAMSFILYLDWMQNRTTKYLIWSGIFFGMAMFVKNDAIIFLPAYLAVLFIKENRRFFQKIKDNIIFLLSLIAASSPWIFFMIRYKLGFGNVEGVIKIGWHPEIWKSAAEAMFSSNNWWIWWYLLAAILIISVKRIRNDRLLIFSWLFLLTYSITLFSVYLFTPEYLYVLDKTAFSRNLSLILPITMLIFILTMTEKNAILSNQ